MRILIYDISHANEIYVMAHTQFPIKINELNSSIYRWCSSDRCFEISTKIIVKCKCARFVFGRRKLSHADCWVDRWFLEKNLYFRIFKFYVESHTFTTNKMRIVFLVEFVRRRVHAESLLLDALEQQSVWRRSLVPLRPAKTVSAARTRMRIVNKMQLKCQLERLKQSWNRVLSYK